jgi:hypothetical protein
VPILVVVAGKVMTASTASQWQALFSWELKAIVASFQLENPFEIYSKKAKSITA